MGRSGTSAALVCTLMMLGGACSKGDKDGDAAKEGAEKPAPAAEAPGEPSLQVAVGDEQDPGPVPPQSSMAFFVVEGGLLPLGCFDQEKKAIATGSDCLDLVPAGAEVRLGSGSATAVYPVGEPVAPLCTAGSATKSALSVEGLGDGATFYFGAWPRSAFKVIEVVGEDTLQAGSNELDANEKAALLAAIGGGAKGADVLQVHQRATVALGEGAPDRIYSVIVPDPRSSERYRWSGLFLAPGGDLQSLILLEQSKSKEDVFEVRGTMDLDGDGTRELWVRMVFAEGAGDRLLQVSGGKPKPVAGWTCGAA